MANVKKPRLPALPFAAYEPPKVIPSPVETAAKEIDQNANQEVYSSTIAFPSRGVGSPGHAPQVSIYTTKAAWRGCDVFVEILPPTAGLSSAILVSVFIYAIGRGARTLVASGRVAGVAGATVVPAKWVAGARTIQQKYEVVVQCTQATGAAVVAGKMTVSIAASNEAVALPRDLGAEEIGPCYLLAKTAQTAFGVGILGVDIPDRLELVTVRGINGSAAARFLQLFDTALNALVAGSVPIMSWPLGVGAGAGLPDTPVSYRCTTRVQLVASSTALTLTQEADCAIGAELR